MFIFTGISQLRNYKETVQYLTSQKVPFPKLSALMSSLLSISGGAGIVFHKYSLYGSILIILFLLPATFFGHRFWSVKNKKEKTNQMQHFMKNISLIGGAIVIALSSLSVK
jgi:Predicted membrane protein